MLLMGDEVRRSQGGNNNAWCQNNRLGWMHWQPDADDRAVSLFVQRLIQLRHHLAGLLNPEIPHTEGRPVRFDQPGHIHREWHGVELGQPDWAAWSHTLAWSLHDHQNQPLLWCGLNAYASSLSFDLPECSAGWLRVIDTGLPPGEDLPAEPQPLQGSQLTLCDRSLVLLVAEPLLRGQQLPGH
jgi:glycogen operon protein